MGGFAYGIGDWWRRLQENSAQEDEDALVFRSRGGFAGAIGRGLGSIRDDFNRGLEGPGDPVIAGQRQALLSNAMFGEPESRPTVPPPMPPPTPAAEPAESSAPEASAMEAALTRGLQRRAALEQPSRFANMQGQDLRNALGYSDDTAKVAAREAMVGPPETRSAFGQSYTPVSGGGGVSTFTNHESITDDLVRQMNDSQIAARTADPLGLIADSRRAQAEQAAKVGGALAIEQGKASIQDQQQQRRMAAYSAAIQEAEQTHAEVIARIEASALAPEVKEQRKAEAASRHAADTLRTKEAFGVGLGMAGLIAKPDAY